MCTQEVLLCASSSLCILSMLAAFPGEGGGAGAGGGQRAPAAGGDPHGPGGGSAERPASPGSGELPDRPATGPTSGTLQTRFGYVSPPAFYIANAS